MAIWLFPVLIPTHHSHILMYTVRQLHLNIDLSLARLIRSRASLVPIPIPTTLTATSLTKQHIQRRTRIPIRRQPSHSASLFILLPLSPSLLALPNQKPQVKPIPHTEPHESTPT